MKHNLSIFAWISLSTFLLSLSAPATHPQIHAQTPHQESVSLLASSPQANDEAIDAFVEDLMANWQIPGLSLTVTHDPNMSLSLNDQISEN
ncbi:MAG: hypothetical protein AAFV85_18860 [Cyanobacteria bacterium J06634_6]